MSSTSTPAVPGVSATLIGSLRGKIDKIETIFNQTTAKVAKLITDPRLSIGATTQQIQDAREEMEAAVKTVKATALQDLQKVKTETESERDIVLRAVASAMGRPTPASATEALLREQRQGAAWARHKPLLDRQPSDYSSITRTVKQTATEAIAAGDDDTLAALRLELVPYMRGRNVPAPEEAAKQLDELIGAARPAVAGALALQREVEKGVASILMAVNHVSGAIERNTPFLAIVNWDGKTTRNLKMPDVEISQKLN